MLVFAIIVTSLAAGVGLEWIVRNMLALRFWRGMFHLTVDYPLKLDDWPTLSLVVPARNEETNIETCLTSLLAQDYPRLEVIVVNDRSTDATGRIIRGINPNAKTPLWMTSLSLLATMRSWVCWGITAPVKPPS